MKYLGRTIFLGFLIGVVISFIVIGLQVLNGRVITFNKAFIIELGIFQLYSLVLTLINGSYFDYLNTKVVWKKYAKYRIAIGALGSVFFYNAGDSNFASFYPNGTYE